LERNFLQIQDENNRLGKRAGANFTELTPRPSLACLNEIMEELGQKGGLFDETKTGLKNAIDFKSKSTK
jgi:hypothetical protein